MAGARLIETFGTDQQRKLFVKNLFNEKGVVGLFTEQYMGTDPAQNYYGNGSKEYIARPRTIGLNVRYNF